MELGTIDMPWKVVKRDCKQADGKKGKYVIVKVKSGGKTEKESCHTSDEKAKSAVRARYANEKSEGVSNVMKITRSELKKLIQEELGKAAPFGSNMQQAKLDKDQKKIIGHTWLTHVKRKASALKEVGEVLWHSMNEQGVIGEYDVFWPELCEVETGIKADLLEAVKMQEHSHGPSESEDE